MESLPAFRISLYFCQKHEPKSQKFNVLSILHVAKEHWLFLEVQFIKPGKSSVMFG